MSRVVAGELLVIEPRCDVQREFKADELKAQTEAPRGELLRSISMRVEPSQVRAKWTTNKRPSISWVSLSNVIYGLLTLGALLLFMQDAQASSLTSPNLWLLMTC